MPAHLFHKHQKVQNHAAHLVFKTKLDHVTSHPLFCTGCLFMFALSTSSLSFNFFEGTHSAYFSNFFFPYIPLQCSSDQNIPYTPVPKTVIYGHWLLAVMQPNSETICALTVHSKYLFSVSINTVHYKSLFS